MFAVESSCGAAFRSSGAATLSRLRLLPSTVICSRGGPRDACYSGIVSRLRRVTRSTQAHAVDTARGRIQCATRVPALCPRATHYGLGVMRARRQACSRGRRVRTHAVATAPAQRSCSRHLTAVAAPRAPPPPRRIRTIVISARCRVRTVCTLHSMNLTAPAGAPSGTSFFSA